MSDRITNGLFSVDKSLARAGKIINKLNFTEYCRKVDFLCSVLGILTHSDLYIKVIS